MPYSGTFTDDLVRHIIAQWPALDRVLDVGAGTGKYARLLKDGQPGARVTGVEIDSSYIDQFGLRDFYTDLRLMDCLRLLDNPDEQWDAVIIGDTIEHLRKSDGRDLVEFLLYRCKWLLVIYPQRQLQNAWQGHHHEAHISLWNEHDWRGLPVERVMWQVAHKQVVLLDGLQKHERLPYYVWDRQFENARLLREEELA